MIDTIWLRNYSAINLNTHILDKNEKILLLFFTKKHVFPKAPKLFTKKFQFGLEFLLDGQTLIIN